MKIAAIVLAAGLSRRFGSVNKLLADMDGIHMIRRVVESITKSAFDRILIVTGHQSQDIRETLQDLPGLEFISNPNYEHGISTSIVKGVSQLKDEDACAICLADLPFLIPQDYNELLETFRKEGARDRILIPVYLEKQGHPVFFGSSFFPDLKSLPVSDSGAKEVIRCHQSKVITFGVKDDRVLRDIDATSDMN